MTNEHAEPFAKHEPDVAGSWLMDNDRPREKVKRPQNAFFLYKSSIAKINKGSVIDLSKEAGKLWAEESAETKASFQLLADEERREHFRKYPNFKWRQRKDAHLATRSAVRISPSIDSMLSVIPPSVASHQNENNSEQRRETYVLQSYAFNEFKPVRDQNSILESLPVPKVNKEKRPYSVMSLSNLVD